jgi:transposase
MDLLYARCAGLDVHKKTVVACVRVVEAATIRREVRTFATTTPGLEALGAWLKEEGCTHAVLESTGIYWKPVWTVLATTTLELVLAHAVAVRNLPGHKSDVKDARWLADLLAHGLVRPSFVPPAAQQALRELTRTRKQLVREITAHTQRIHKLLASANVLLEPVVTNLLGPSGRAIVTALATGETDADRLAACLHRRSHGKRATLVAVVAGARLQAHQRVLLRHHLALIASIEASVAALDEEIATALQPFHAAVACLVTVPGISHTAAAVIIAELGIDMRRFPHAGNARAWTGLCPQLNQSADKHGSRRLRPGAPWLKPILVQAAWVAVRVPDSYCRALYHRLARRSGKKQAIVAVAASLLTAIYHMLRDVQPYHDLGAHHLTTVDRARQARRLTSQLRHLGYQVQLQEVS